MFFKECCTTLLFLYCLVENSHEVSLKYMGCYRDTERRILPDVFTTLPDNSPGRCVYHCLRAGYQYAGVQYRSQCFCGETKPVFSLMLPESNCQMDCPKSTLYRCGGDWSMNVYNTGLSGVSLEYSYLGCYQDKSKRIITGPQTMQADNTPRRCVNQCLRSGYQYAGVQFGNECFCGETKPSDSALLPESKCDMTCPKSPLYTCGGSLTMNVYNTGLPEVSLIYLGCYHDNEHRILRGGVTNFPDNSPGRCVYHCLRTGYEYAGVQYGTECFCGKTKPPKSIQLHENKCNMHCPKSTSIRCGGDYSMNVYFTGLPEVSLEYIGCYQDESNRILTGPQTMLADNTPRRCVDQCLSAGYQYAGVQFGNECFCGEIKPPNSSLLLESKCDMACPKSPFYRCGGSMTMNVYNTGLPG